MSELDAFRSEVVAWLEENCPESQRQPSKPGDMVYGGKRWQFDHPDQKLWLDRMAAKGWTAPEWPAEYGGGGLSSAQAKILKKEMKALGCRLPLTGHGLWMLGPALLEFGTEEQKLTHLPSIISGEIRWCQGYSEPGAGSDLASLRCRADNKGDHFLVNGQKCWTTNGDVADWMFCLVRTDFEAKKQAGISFLLIDMADPGITVRPVELINGNTDFCDSFIENVKVPKENLVGELNQGWSVAKALLVHERTMMSQLVDITPKLPMDPPGFAKKYIGLDEQGKLRDPALRQRLVRHQMNQRVMGLSQFRAFEEGMAGVLDRRSTSYFKSYATEEDKAGAELLIEILGHQGLGWEGDSFEDSELQVTRQWLMSKGLSLGGGTTEVQLNLIAKQLGLPD